MAKKKGKGKSQKPQNTTTMPTDAGEAKLENNLFSKGIPPTLPAINQCVFMKLCRLCEAKDGPFLNIFDAEKVTAKKIDDLMPFIIAENDDLPHKICFRCSAKLEELHEFVQKCIKTQENLRSAIGITDVLPIKQKSRLVWEEKLNKSKITNEDICDALIKKAMEGIKDIPVKSSIEEQKSVGVVNKEEIKETDNKNDIIKKEDNEDIPLNKLGYVMPVRSSKLKISQILSDETLTKGRKSSNKLIAKKTILSNEIITKSHLVPQNDNRKEVDNNVNNHSNNTSSVTVDSKFESTLKEAPDNKVLNKDQEQDSKPFNIKDYVSTIKVTGVGALFQCKLCNRNFLKEEVVMNHSCAKNGGKIITDKIDLTKSNPTPEPPKVSNIKYINTKDFESKKPEPETKSKPKPKIGPASKVKRINECTVNPVTTADEPKQPHPSTATDLSSVKFPNTPNLQSRYKLVPGPNNTFTLVEDQDVIEVDKQNSMTSKSQIKENGNKNKVHQSGGETSKNKRKNKGSSSPEIIDLDAQPCQPEENTANQQPYPVGLFQTVPHHSSTFSPPITPVSPPVLTTPAMKKQSYTIVPTGNPSKLLISTKVQPVPLPVEVTEPTKKKPRKAKNDSNLNASEKSNANPTADKERGFFTFINVDPLQQPSYVLPTDSTIQESQITTSTPLSKPTVNLPKDNSYSCNMCGEKFSREKKLLTHIQSHYTQMDEEDKQRTVKPTRKRGRQS